MEATMDNELLLIILFVLLTMYLPMMIMSLY
nr:MAG TPA: sporulation protein [Caudoviricetes sp.]DAK96207.1 MAG TPA: Stage II sporulation protein [Caudoviricetes sp.]DAN92399.1 MAG TPA: Stage II sporulation protein [Caudoviricetes sp.]DAS10657.1 MAG TPA: Stage II sporulation protein [Caudoviricetes sp.]